ncbi:hypothetical protein NC651_006224 [Populus alba x Populus x berolinensis]|nr:hypothetical protein NC651_006224 [Populus alba x Populus x berolinensis]
MNSLAFNIIMFQGCMLLSVLKARWTLYALLVQLSQLIRGIQMRLPHPLFTRLIAMSSPHHPLLSRKRKGVRKRRRPVVLPFSFPFYLLISY